MNPLHKKILVLSLLCYGVALFLPGLAARGANPYGFTGYNGFMCLAWGCVTVFGGWKYFLPWTANCLYFPALLLWAIGPRARIWGALLAVGGLVLAALTFRIDSVLVNEAGHRAAVRPGLGAWLWMASMLVLVLGAFLKDDRGRLPSP